MINNTLEKWEEKTLGEILDKGSSNLSANKLNDCVGIYPVYGASGLIAKVDFYQQDKEYLAIIKDGAGVGRVYHYQPKTSVLGTLQYLYPKPNTNIRFAYYYLQSIDFAKYYQGAAIPHIYYRDYKSEKLVLPPLPEQERIVAKLDKAFKAIDKVKANAEQNLNNAQELYKVVLNRVFNSNKYQFEHIKLNDLCEIITDGTHQTPTYADKGVIFLSAKNVTSEVIDWENIKYIPDSLHNELKKRVSPQKGDILLAKNGTTGVAAIVDRDCVFDIYVSLCMLRPKKTVNVQYLLLAINNPITKDKFNKSLIGIGVPNLHLNKIRETTVPIPSPKFQDEISSLLNGLKAEYLKLEQIYTQKIKECDELKQSILQKAFRGEL